MRSGKRKLEPREVEDKKRGPYQTANHDFVAEKIQEFPVKVSDMFGHYLVVKAEMPYKTIADRLFEKVVSDVKTRFVGQRFKGDRWLTVQMRNKWGEYQRLKGHAVKNQHLIKALLDEPFHFTTDQPENITPTSITPPPTPPPSPSDATEAPSTTNNIVAVAPVRRSLSELYGRNLVKAMEEPTENHCSCCKCQPKNSVRNTTDISLICELGLRFGLNYTQIACLASVTLVVYDIITQEHTTEIIDRQKVIIISIIFINFFLFKKQQKAFINK